ncbi:MAG: hypothetical protein HXS53_09650 [Theionarchaea archaeon]|nr:hypothetical protein [Theionarchaea archaeon]
MTSMIPIRLIIWRWWAAIYMFAWRKKGWIDGKSGIAIGKRINKYIEK